MKSRNTKRTTKKGKKIGFNDRAGFIVNAFREMPEKRFTLKYLAAASGGADKEGRNIFLTPYLSKVTSRRRARANTTSAVARCLATRE